MIQYFTHLDSKRGSNTVIDAAASVWERRGGTEKQRVRERETGREIQAEKDREIHGEK